ncbi:uncharacterized protein LOC143027572 [Oratosquilla oratoria]|uniref:uncharacterized protein LOC143027572 n=1 Tax=Oratosquilla oratoria TaxID=337810 RepID=UPI003F76AB05
MIYCNLHDEDILTTVELRQKNFTLLVAFDCISPTNSSASNSSDDSNRASVVNNSETSNTSRVLATGNIIIDDGVSLNSDINSTWQFEATEYSLTINRTDDNNFCDEVIALNISSTVEKLWVFGVPADTEVSVTLDGSLQAGSTHMNNLALDLCDSSSYSIEWK